MARRSIKVVEPHLLLVEGDVDERFLRALFAAHGRSDIQIEPIGGKDDLAAWVMVFVQSRGFGKVRWFGIALDADADAGAAFASIRGALRRARLSVLQRPWQLAGVQPVTCAVVFPDGQRSGDIESWAWDAVASEPAAPCVDAYLQCLQMSGTGAIRRESKARMYAYLASLPRPEMRLSEAAEAGALPLTSSAFDRLIDLLP